MKFSDGELRALKDLIEITIDEKLDRKLNEKLGLKPGETLQEKLSHLPTKDEFYEAMDKVMKELKAIREESRKKN